MRLPATLASALFAVLAFAPVGEGAHAAQSGGEYWPAQGVSLLESGMDEAWIPRAVLRYNPQPSNLRVPPPPQPTLGGDGLMAQQATITVNYLPAGSTLIGETCTTWPETAKSAFSYATNIWASLLQSAVTIKVDACWATTMEAGVLGAAGPATFYRDFAGAPTAGTWFPVAPLSSIRTPTWSLPEMRLRAPAAVPPTVLPGALLMCTPLRVLPRSAAPVTSVPM